jgi:GNAT superfamily N-acetyltransferase
MRTSSWTRVDRYWADELGLASVAAELPPMSCRAQSRFRGVQVFRIRDAVVIAAPPARVDRVRDAIAGRRSDEVFSTEWLANVFGGDAERILGPAALHYADATTFRFVPGATARALVESDSGAYRDFVTRVSPAEVEESGIPAEVLHVYGAFVGDALCGVAHLEEWRSVIAQIGVVTDPARRRRGIAKEAVSALARDALDRGLILQWRALVSNEASVCLARAIGFEYYASTIFVRLGKP